MVILPEYVKFTVMQQEKMRKKKKKINNNKQTRNMPCTECILLAFKMCGENYCHRSHLCQLLEHDDHSMIDSSTHAHIHTSVLKNDVNVIQQHKFTAHKTLKHI